MTFICPACWSVKSEIKLALVPYSPSPIIGIGSVGSWLVALALLRMRQVGAASAVITLFLWSMPTFFILNRGGLSEMSGNPFVLTVLFGFASMGGRGLAASLTLCIATVLGITALEASGGIPPSTAPQPPLLMYAISDITVLVMTAAMAEYGVRRTTLHLARVQQERAKLAEAEKRQERQIHLALALGQMGHLLLERDRSRDAVLVVDDAVMRSADSAGAPPVLGKQALDLRTIAHGCLQRCAKRARPASIPTP